MNLLFTDEPGKGTDDNDHPLPRPGSITHADNAAVQMIRNKIDALYRKEPDAKQEVAAVERVHDHRSKHQQFMHHLTTSGRSMAKIQAAWHEYYAQLSDKEKHEVWQEFYQANATTRAALTQKAEANQHTPQEHELHKPVTPLHTLPALPRPIKGKHKSVTGIKKDVITHVQVSNHEQSKAKQHLQSLAFGLGLGALALLIASFGLFNEMVVTPFIRPGSASATPIILNADGPAPSSTPEVIIPKLNAQIPVIYDGQSLAEEEVQKALEKGVFHYPITSSPGQNGNVAIFGHSSNNIFNKGKYKFAFVLLHEMEPGDIFYLTYEGKIFTYKVFTKKVVAPEETWVLTSTEGKTATAALITCDPPGSTKHRLVVWGEQISPDPNANAAAAEPATGTEVQDLPGKSQSWLTRLNPFD
jgi:LPXTG-site transpeptidase (sortase) family protein